jgi:hypothetical protein
VDGEQRLPLFRIRRDGLAGSDELSGQQRAEPAGALDRTSARFVPRQQPIALMRVSD